MQMPFVIKPRVSGLSHMVTAWNFSLVDRQEMRGIEPHLGAPGCWAAWGRLRMDTERRATRMLTTASVAISRVLSNSCLAATARMARSLECAPADCADIS